MPRKRKEERLTQLSQDGSASSNNLAREKINIIVFAVNYNLLFYLHTFKCYFLTNHFFTFLFTY